MTTGLRSDLILSDAGRDHAGNRLTLIFDPLKNSYFRISAAALALRTSNDPDTREQRQALDRELARQGLTSAGFRDEALRQQARSAQHRWRGLLHGYLFFRIPLLRPDRLLDVAVARFGLVFRPAFWWCVAFIWIGATFLILRQPDAFLIGLESLLSLQGITFLAAALLGLKLFHELGHGLAARHFGARVPSMGIAFMLLAPLFYTDTTDAWKLPRPQRIRIALAGVMAESVVAGIMLLSWSFLDPGAMRDLALAIAITGLSTSLLVNLNPLMRFDGYFILSDLIGIDNLQQRSFALGRWRLRETLFKLGEPSPEDLPRAFRAGLAFLAYATWIYRLGLYLGIALAVYAFFVKAIGILLFLIEIAVFIAMPIWRETAGWWRERTRILRQPRSWLSLAVFASLLLVLVLPLDRHVKAPARLSGAEVTALYPAMPGEIVAIKAVAGQQLKAGDPILILASPNLEHDRIKARLQLEAAMLKSRRLAASARDRALSRVTEEERIAALERLAALQRESDRLVIRAPFDGVLVEIERDLHSGRSIGMTTRIGRVMRSDQSELRGYVSEVDQMRLRAGGSARFIADDPRLASIEARLSQIAPANEKQLALPELADRQAGSIRSSGRRDAPEAADSIFMIRLETAARPPAHALTGIVLIEAEPQSLAVLAFRRIARVLLRESQF
jgi:putative peptide zinc metalloprotease protein